MKKILSILFLILLAWSSTAYADNYHRVWPFTSLTGGGSGSLDGAISGVSINPNDAAFGTYVEGGVTKWALLRVNTSGAAESSPDIITPDDVGAGTTRWGLVTSSDQNLRKVSSPTFSNLTINSGIGGASIYTVYSGTTLTANMLGGGLVYVFTPLSGSTPTVIGVPAITGSTGFCVIKDMTGGGVTVQTTDGETLYDDDEAGTAIFVNQGNSRHQVSIMMVTESGTCKFMDVLGTIGSNWLIK